jgi:formyl-CoA transferase
MSGPLTGVRVLDLTNTVLGPLATQTLGDMGADVWKIESPAGDPMRGVGPSRNPGMGPYFLSLNRNKRSIVLDLKHPAARPAIERMIVCADVLVATVRPRALERLGLGYERARALNPRIIYCNAVGYRQDGRYAPRPAYDDLIQGASGLGMLFAASGGAPRYVPLAVADRTVGLATAGAIAMALYHRERTGEGQQVEVPMFETMAQLVMSEHQYGRYFEPPLGTTGYPRMLDPNRKPYPTRDGYVSALVYTDAHWQRFFELAGHPEMRDDPRYARIEQRTEHIGELYAFVAQVLAQLTTADALRLLDEADIPVAPVHTPESLLADPHIADVGFFAPVEHPTEGTIRPPGIATRWSASTPEVRRQAPRLGEHTREVLLELGISAADVDELKRLGAAFGC